MTRHVCRTRAGQNRHEDFNALGIDNDCNSDEYSDDWADSTLLTMVEDKIEQTLFVAKEVNVYKIPPRQGAGGHRSGDWMVADKIFTGRLRVVSIGELCELRLEDRSR